MIFEEQIYFDKMDALVSLKTAEIAKAKGFNWNTLYHIDLFRPDYPVANGDMDILCYRNMNQFASKISVPTQASLQRWLREVYDIHIHVEVYNIDDENKYDYTIVSELIEGDTEDDLYHDSYEETLELALLDALSLIK